MLTISNRICHPLLVLLLLAGTAARAHNGRLAIGMPVQDILVDGDLSDWPADLPRYSVTLTEAGDAPDGPADFSANFRVGYSEQDDHLYVAVEVRDESIYLNPPGGNAWWNSSDGCDVFLGLEHSGRGGHVAQMAYWGNSVHTYGDVKPQAFDVVMRPHPGGRVYEWSIDVAAVYGRPFALHPGLDLAFDVVVSDKDEDGSFSWMAWGSRSQKLISPVRLGDVMLVGAATDLEDAMDSAGEMIQRTTQRTASEVRTTTSYLALLSGSLLAVSLLHILLFGFQRESRTNLYYAIYTGCTAAAVFASFHFPVISVPDLLKWTESADLAMAVAGVFGFGFLVYGSSLLFLYAFFYERIPLFGRGILIGMVALPASAGLAMLVNFFSDSALALGSFLGIIVMVGVPLLAITLLVEIPRIVLAAVIRRKPGAWSVGVGFLVFAVCGVVITISLLSREPIEPLYLLGIVLPLGTMSYRLARSVATVHRDLAERYREVEALSQQLKEQNRALELANIQIREQSLRVSEADRLKSDFLARMSHDLRTPLNAIIGYTRILLRRVKGEVAERQYRNLENIRVSADNLLALINDILDLSRIESGRNELRIDDVDITQIMAQCAASLESLVPETVEFTTRVEADLPVIQSDADRIRRVLMNLAGNALKYTESGRVTMSAGLDGEHLRLEIADTGLGIPAQDLPHIFDEFRQVDRRDRKREGSGLGLAIARKSVEMLGGTIDVASQVAEGSTFTVLLPLAVVEEGVAAPGTN